MLGETIRALRAFSKLLFNRVIHAFEESEGLPS